VFVAAMVGGMAIYMSIFERPQSGDATPNRRVPKASALR
jgi:hypothetical protein